MIRSMVRRIQWQQVEEVGPGTYLVKGVNGGGRVELTQHEVCACSVASVMSDSL